MNHQRTKNKKLGAVILQPGCTNACLFCGRFNKEDKRIRKDVVSAYKNLLDFKKQGIKNIVISGNDPLEYDRINEMISYIKDMGFEFIKIATNGVRLADNDFFEKFINSGVDKVKIPLYGSRAKIHDAVTQTPDSFNKTLKGIKGMLRKGKNIEIQITSLLLKQNKNNLLDLIDLVNEDLKIRKISLSIPCIANNDYSYYVPFKMLSPYVRKVYNYALEKKYKVFFTEIPYCVFGEINRKVIDNTSLPPNLGKYCQPLGKHKTSIKDMPAYRLKKRIKMCEKCKAFSFCDGFFVNDINKFGADNLKPII